MKNCIGCNHPGKNCVSYLMTLSPEDVGEWCKARKQAMGTTNEEIADQTGVPVGTVKRIMAEKATDCRFSTMQPIICFLSGCKRDELDCEPGAKDETLKEKVASHEATITRLEEENRRKYDIILHMQGKGEEDINQAKKEEAESIAYLKAQMKSRLITIYVLASALAATLFLIIITLAIDLMNNGIGFIR